MGAFDDLIPATAPGPFDDLVPSAAGGFQQMQDKTESDLRLRQALALRAAIEKGAQVIGGTSPVDTSITPFANVLPGIGQGLNQTILGGKQLLAKTGIGNPAELAKQVDETTRLDQPLLNTPGGFSGSLIGSNAALLPIGTAAMAGAARIPGLISALRTAISTAPEAIPQAASVARAGIPSLPGDIFQGAAGGTAIGAVQPYGEQGSSLENIRRGAITGAAGGAGGNLMARAIQPAGQLSPQQAGLADYWANRGVPMTAGQLAGPGTLPYVAEQFVGDNPFGRVLFGTGKQRSLVQNIIGQEAGMTPQEMAAAGNKFQAASATLAPAENRAGAVWDKIRAQPGASATPQFAADLSRQADYLSNPQSLLETSAPSPALSSVRNVQQAAADSLYPTPMIPRLITGAQARDTTQELRQLAEGTQNKTDAGAYNRLKSSINRWTEDAFNIPELAQTNRQAVVRGTLSDPGVVDARTGNVNFGGFNAALKRDNPGAYLTQPLPLQQFGERVGQLQDTFPQSGTAPRAALQHMGTLLAGALAGGAYGTKGGNFELGDLGELGAAVPGVLLAALLAGRRPAGWHTSPSVSAAASAARLLTPQEMAILDAQRARQNEQSPLPVFGQSPP